MTDGDMPRSHGGHDLEEEEEGNGNLAIEEAEDDGHGGHGGVCYTLTTALVYCSNLVYVVGLRCWRGCRSPGHPHD